MNLIIYNNSLRLLYIMAQKSIFEPRSLSGLIEGNFTSLDVASQDIEGKEHIKIDGEFLHTDIIQEKADAENQFFVDARHHLHRMKDVWYHDAFDAPFPNDGNDYEPTNNQLLIYDTALTHPASGHTGYWRNSSTLTAENISVNTLYTDNIREKTATNDIHVHNNVNMENTNITNINALTSTTNNTTTTNTNNIYTDNIYELTPTGNINVNNLVDMKNNNVNNVNTITSTTNNTNNIYTDNIYELTPTGNINVNNLVDMKNNNVNNVNTITNTTSNTNNIYTDNIYELTPAGNININNLVDVKNNRITNVADPTTGTDAINKNFFDLQTIKGALTKKNCDYATTSNIILSGEQTIDGFLTSNSRVLVKDQTDQKQNGIYDTGSGAWTRSDDLDNAPSAEIFNGVWTFIKFGTLNTGFAYRITSQGTGPNELHQIGTDNIIWDLSNINFTVQDPIIKTGDQISLNYTSNLQVTGNSLNTIQDIQTTSDVEFNSVTAGGNNQLNTIYNYGTSDILIENQLQDIILRTQPAQLINLDSPTIKINASVPVSAQTYTLGIDASNNLVKHTPAINTASYPLQIVADDIQLKYDNTNLKINVSNELTTIQEINVTAQPTFAGINSTFDIEMNSNNINEVDLLELNGLKSIGGNTVPIISYHSLVPDPIGAVIDAQLGILSNPWVNAFINNIKIDELRSLTGAPINILDEIIVTATTGTPTHHLAIDSSNKVIRVLPSVVIAADLDFYSLYDIINLVELRFSSTVNRKIEYFTGYETLIQPSTLAHEVPLASFHRFTTGGNQRLEISNNSVKFGILLDANGNNLDNLTGINFTNALGNKIVYFSGYYTNISSNLFQHEAPLTAMHRWTINGAIKLDISNTATTILTPVLMGTNYISDCSYINLLDTQDIKIRYRPTFYVDTLNNGINNYVPSGAIIRNYVGGLNRFEILDTSINCYRSLNMKQYNIDDVTTVNHVLSLGTKTNYYGGIYITEVQSSLLRHEIPLSATYRWTTGNNIQLQISSGVARFEGRVESVGDFYTSNIYGFGGSLNIQGAVFFPGAPITGVPGYNAGFSSNQIVKFVSDRRIKKNIQEMTYDDLLPLIDIPIYKYQMKTHEELQADKTQQPEERQNDIVYNCVKCDETEQEIIGMVLDETPNYFKRGTLKDGLYPAYMEAVPILMKLVNEQSKMIKDLQNRLNVLENK